MARPGRPKKKTAEAVVKDIKRQTRRKFNAEERSVLFQKDSREKNLLLKYAEEKALLQLYITNGVKTSQKQERSV